MIGVVVITHGELSNGLLHSLKMIMGEQENVSALSLTEGQDMEQFGENVYQTITATDTGKGVLVFVDIYGATPFNTVFKQMKKFMEESRQVKIITGVNLPMLMETVSMRAMKDLEELFEMISESGKLSIEAVKF